MNNVFTLVAIGVVGWLLNFLFGYMQIKNFNKSYIDMRKKGRVVIGRKRGYLQAGTIILLNIDNEDTIFDCKIMQGISVLAKVKTFKGLEGKNIGEITKDHLTQYRKLTRIAILNAIDNFNQFKEGRNEEKQINI
ncbi:MAG: transcriptional regulator GutM [Clostridiaceae bacterium]